MMVRNILISTDIGTDIDDAVALYLAEVSPEIIVDGVYVTNGDVERRGKIAKNLLNKLGSKTGVYIGESEALTRKNPYHMEFEPIYLTKSENERKFSNWGIELDGISSLEEKIEEKVKTIASLAPLTNIAKLLHRNPSIENKIEKLYLMGGREYELEHNFHYDVESAKQVLNSNLDILIVSADICDKFRLDADFLCNLDSCDANTYIALMARALRIFKETNGIRDLMHQGLYKAERKAFEKTGKKQGLELSGSIRESLDIITNPQTFLSDFNKAEDFYKIFSNYLMSFDDTHILHEVGNVFRESKQKGFKVCDAFVIYSILHPEKTEISRTNATIDDRGVMRLQKGERYEIITDIDYEHFNRYLRRELLKPISKK